MDWPPIAGGFLVGLLVLAGGLLAFGLGAEAVQSVGQVAGVEGLSGGGFAIFLGIILLAVAIVLYVTGRRS